MSDREKNGLRGQVASVRTEFFSCDQQTGEVSGRARQATIETYDPVGQIQSLISENQDGSVSTTTYIYTIRDGLTEIRSEFNGMLHGSAVSEYDAAGRLVRTTNQAHNGAKWQSASCTYDDEGNKVEVLFPLPDFALAEMMASAKRAQQALGNPAGEVGYDASLVSTRTIHYDFRGNRLEELRHNENQELTGRTIYTYDDHGRLAEKREEIGQDFLFGSALDDPRIEPLQREALRKAFDQMSQQGTSTFRTTYSYDDQDRKSEELSHQGPFGFSKQTFEYDEYGNLTAVHYLSENREVQVAPEGQFSNPAPSRRDGYTHHFGYTYDSYGNWIQKTLTSVNDTNDQPHYADVERRIITYHSSEV